jgi:hypothetical protein
MYTNYCKRKMREDIVGIYVTSASWNIVPINMVNYISLQERKKNFEIVYIYTIEDSLVLISVCPSEKKQQAQWILVIFHINTINDNDGLQRVGCLLLPLSLFSVLWQLSYWYSVYMSCQQFNATVLKLMTMPVTRRVRRYQMGNQNP